MFEISEEVKDYCRGGNLLKKDFYKQVSELLLAERLSRRRTLEELCNSTGVSAKLIEKQELRRKKMNWCIVAALLKLYKKKLVVNFEDDVGEGESRTGSEFGCGWLMGGGFFNARAFFSHCEEGNARRGNLLIGNATRSVCGLLRTYGLTPARNDAI